MEPVGAEVLFSPVEFGGLTLPNRIAMSSMTRSRTPGGVPNALNAEYYAQRASAGLVFAESTAVSVGNLAINHLAASDADLPFGGMKDSGLGREGGIEGPLNHTVVKTVSTLFH